MFLLPCLVFAQKPKLVMREQTKAEQIIQIKHDQCFYRNVYSAAQRRAFFPFNKAAAVKIISFIHEEPKDTAITYPYERLATNRFKLNKHKVLEMIQLAPAGVDSLTDLLYNVGYTPVKKLPAVLTIEEMKCYSPRNAILFFDADGNLTQYMEFCFTCRHYYLSSSKIKNTVYCEQKYDMLKNFFLSRGIKYVEE
jgi:hypothetical protein